MRWTVTVFILLCAIASSVPAADPPQGRDEWFPTFSTEWVFETGG